MIVTASPNVSTATATFQMERTCEVQGLVVVDMWENDDGQRCWEVEPRHVIPADRHPGTKHLLQYFTFDHLPVHLRRVSKLFCDAAFELIDQVDDGPELTVSLRKLLEAKDAGVRAFLAEESP